MIKESNMFGDVLSSIMNDDKEKIKKRKIAERRAERKAKEQVCSMLFYGTFYVILSDSIFSC